MFIKYFNICFLHTDFFLIPEFQYFEGGQHTHMLSCKILQKELSEIILESFCKLYPKIRNKT